MAEGSSVKDPAALSLWGHFDRWKAIAGLVLEARAGPCGRALADAGLLRLLRAGNGRVRTADKAVTKAFANGPPIGSAWVEGVAV